MVVELLPQHEAILAEQLASGRYASSNEVFGDALVELSTRAERERKKAHLRALIQEGIDDLEMNGGVEVDVMEIYEAMRAGK